MAIKGYQQNGIEILGNIDEINFFDVKRFMARKAAALLFGQGVVITSENETIKKFLKEFTNANQLDDLLLQAAEDVAYGGRIIITIDKTKNNEFMLSYANDELLQQVFKIEINPFSAIILRKKVIGNNVWFINETWTTTTVKRSFTQYNADNNTTNQITDVSKIPQELQLPIEETHNLGFVPFIEHTNKPARNILLNNQEGHIQIQDDFVVRHMPLHINNGLRQWFKEEILGKSKIIGNFTEQELAKMKGNSAYASVLNDLIIKSQPTPNQAKPIETMPASYNNEPWTNATKEKINMYAIGCGYSPIFQDGGQQTEAETLFNKDNDTRTTKEKRRRWQITLKDLFAKLIVYNGLASDLEAAKDEFSVEIKENVVYNQLQLTDFLANNVANGFMTRAEAIMLQRDLDDIQEAEEILKQIEKDQQEVADTQLANDAKALETVNDSESSKPLIGKGNGGGVGAMASGQDSDPTSE